jgi:hypothetical protein
MEVVVVDVKHLDVVLRRPDGGAAYPKIIAFEDTATGRAFLRVVIPEKGEGVRQEYVNDAFIAMAVDPRWGLPQALLYDRGSENGALECLRAPMGELCRSGAQVIFKSKPYNPQSKPIEGFFGRFDDFVSQIPGYIGPDRTKKKTQTLGRPPEPFPGTFQEFCEVVQTLVETFNTWPVGGGRKGRSPENIFTEKLNEGWRPATIDPLTLEAAFRKREYRNIDRGTIKVAGERYTHPLIFGAVQRQVLVAIPYAKNDLLLFSFDDDDWHIADVDQPFPFIGPEGAREGDRRRQARKAAVQHLDRSVPDVDALRLVTETRLSEISPIPAGGGRKVDGGAANRALGAAIGRGRQLALVGRADPCPPGDSDMLRLERRLARAAAGAPR